MNEIPELNLKTTVGKYLVSTVKLYADHSFGDGAPLWYETMVKGECGWRDDIQYRYTTIEEAKAGHEKVCGMVAKQNFQE